SEALEHRLHVHHRRPVDRLDGPDPEPRAHDAAHGHGVEADRVRPVGRARGEHAVEPVPGIVARVDVEHVALPLVEPGDDDQLVAGLDPEERRLRPRLHLEPGVGGALGALSRRALSFAERRADVAHGPQRESLRDLRAHPARAHAGVTTLSASIAKYSGSPNRSTHCAVWRFRSSTRCQNSRSSTPGNRARSFWLWCLKMALILTRSSSSDMGTSTSAWAIGHSCQAPRYDHTSGRGGFIR